MKQPASLKGQRFGRLVVVKLRSRNKKNNRHRWECICDCGGVKVADGTSLKMGWTASCGCLARDLRRLRPYGAIYNAIQRSARKRSLSCTLSYEEFLEFTATDECHYCHSHVVWTKFDRQGHKGGQGYNLDRTNNDLGYIKGNLVVCCRRCNAGKRNLFTYEEWYGMAAFLRNKRKNENVEANSTTESN